MKKITIILAFGLMSFGTQSEKKVTMSFSVEEIGVIYDALGDQPAKKVEALRARIAMEYQKQIVDSTKKK